METETVLLPNMEKKIKNETGTVNDGHSDREIDGDETVRLPKMEMEMKNETDTKILTGMEMHTENDIYVRLLVARRSSP